MILRPLLAGLVAGLIALLAPAGPAAAQQTAPDELIRSLSGQILERIRQDKDLQAGDLRKLSQFVDETIMPNVNFERMTALAVGRGWRQATPEQQKQLMAEFRALLLRTYAGALSAVKDQTVRVRPLRAGADDAEVIVRSEIVQGRGEPIQLDYRMEKSGNAWRIYDINVLGVWLVETYRNQFAQEINARGIDGLIKSLAERNRQFAKAS
ncbi:MAG TPA: ABC transporter substrate-binding protein [Burkholderiaceae bacterium]|nr:ABC transporter substrate-binding protein [Burkholderiaceae bacterium]